MAEEPDSLVLKLLREIRERIDVIEGKIDELDIKSDGHAALLVGLGKYIRDIDGRVQHIEEKLGIEG